MKDRSSVPTLFVVLSAVALVLLIAPIVIVVLAGLNAGDYLTFPPKGLSLRWVFAFLSSPIFVPAYLYSLALAAVTATLATIIGTAASIYLARSESRVAGTIRAFLMLPIVLPGIVVGLALLIFFTWSGLGLARTLPGMLIGHVVVTTPFVIATVSAALAGLDRSLEDAARSLGAGPFTAFRKVTLRLISPGIAAGALFASLISFGQFELSLMLAVPDHPPLPLVLYTSLKYEFEPTAAAAGIFAIALVVISTFATSRLINLRRVFKS